MTNRKHCSQLLSIALVASITSHVEFAAAVDVDAGDYTALPAGTNLAMLTIRTPLVTHFIAAGISSR